MTIEGKNILTIYSNKNTKGFKDATGAFILEEQAFSELHEVPEENRLGIPCPGMPAAKRREAVCLFLRDKKDIEFIAWFGHGYSRGIQFGFMVNHTKLLASYMSMCCTKDVSMVFYACSTASTSKKTRSLTNPGSNNSFCDRLRDTMLELGFRGGHVNGHLRPGHTTLQAFVLRFYVEPTFEDMWDVHGGEWLVSPKSALWKKWKAAIQTKGSTYKFIFPMMTEAEIYDSLR